jgi:hypothetical protein
MRANKVIETILLIRKEASALVHLKEIDVNAANETAQLISGSFTYSMYKNIKLTYLNSIS